MSNVTQHLGIPMPDPDGQLEDDVLRLRSAFQLIDSQIWTLREVLSADDADLDTIQEIITVLKTAQGEIGSITDMLASKADKAEVTALAEGLIQDDVTAEKSTWSSSKIGQALDALTEAVTQAAEQIASSKLDKTGGVMKGPILFDQERDLGSVGASVTVDWSKAHSQRATLTANCTIAFTPPAGVFRGSLKLINSAAVARAVTWPAGIRYLGGVAPQVPDAKIGAVAIYAVYWDGSTWWVSGGRYS